MSKQSRKQGNKSRLPLVLIIAAGVVLIAAGIFFARQGSGSPESGGTPKIAVDREEIDYGEVKLDTPLVFTINVTNTGDGVLRFKDAPYIEVQEGC